MLAALRPQATLVHQFAIRRSFTIVRSAYALKTNRDRHFAETGEFFEAVRHAREGDGYLVVGNLLELLTATAPDEIVEALQAAHQPGVTLIDAVTGGPLQKGDATRMVATAIAQARRRRPRTNQKIEEPELGGRQKRRSPASNQSRAARGAASAAQVRAERLRDDVEQILRTLPAGTRQTARMLSEQLNSRGIFTDRGNAWSPAAARNLLRRLELTPSATHVLEQDATDGPGSHQ